MFDWDRILRPGGLLWIDSVNRKLENPFLLDEQDPSVNRHLRFFPPRGTRPICQSCALPSDALLNRRKSFILNLNLDLNPDLNPDPDLDPDLDPIVTAQYYSYTFW